MPDRDLKNGRRTLLFETLVPALFFTCFFLYLYYVIDPQIIYAFNGIGDYAYLLELRRDFFSDMLFTPGGMVTLLMGVITHACHEPWLGSLLITLVGTGFYAVSGFLIRKNGFTPYFPLAWLPALAILFFYGLWYHRWLFSLLTILGAAGFTAAWHLLDRRHFAARILAAIVLFSIAAFSLRHGALLFGFLICLFEFFRSKKQAVQLAALLAATALLLEAAGYHWFNSFRIFNVDQIVRAEPRIWPAYLYFPAVILFLRVEASFHGALVRPFRKKKRASAALPNGKRTSIIRHPASAATAAFLFLLCVMAVAAMFVDRDCRDLGVRLRYLRTGQWENILALDKSAIVGRYYLVKLHIVNIALAKTGQLSRAMFDFPQSENPDALLLITSSLEGSAQNAMAWAVAPELFLHLGALNYAEKFAGEAMGNTGALPFLLRVRALAALARGHRETAAVYLKKLATVPFHRREANDLLKALGDDSRLLEHPAVGRLGEYQDTVDHLMFTIPEEQILRGLVNRSSRNGMALEYLMAWHLQTRQLMNVYRDLPLVDAAERGERPAYYDEAMVIFSRMTGLGEGGGSFPKVSPGPDAWRRMAAFDALYEKHRYSKNTAREMAPVFGSTYFFFFAFGYSGGGR